MSNTMWTTGDKAAGDTKADVRSGRCRRAQLAYERFVLSIRRALGAMAGVLGGVDAVVFTGGIGENSARVRRDSMGALRFAGLELDEQANASSHDDQDISAGGSRFRVLTIRSREDLAILKNVFVVTTDPRTARTWGGR